MKRLKLSNSDQQEDIGKAGGTLARFLNKGFHISVIILGVISFWLMPQQIQADDISVKSTVSASKIGIEDVFIYSIVAETSSSKELDVEVKFDDFPADYLRPSVSTSMSTSFVNGRISSSKSQTHKYTVYPRKEGTLTIPQVDVYVNGKKYQTQKHNIEVVAGSLRPKTTSRSRSNSPFSSFFDDPWDVPQNNTRNNNSFVEVIVSKDSVYVGQNIQAKYYYYTLRNNYNVSYDMQTSDGYGIESSNTENENWERVKYKGKNYLRREITTLNISAQKAGILTLPIIIVNERAFINSNSYKSPETKFIVKGLPKVGKAIDFSNAVGKFTLEAELAQSLMFENQQNQLIVTIKGRGNFAKILYPEIGQVDGLEILKPKATLNLEKEDAGTLILTYDIIPSESGKFKLPTVSFNYFDDTLEKYQTLYSESHLLTVKSIDSNLQSPNSNDYNVFYTRNKPYLKNILSEYLLTNKVSYWLFLSLLIVSILGIYLFHRNRQKLMSNVGYVRKKEALSILKKAIEESEKLVQAKNVKFYTNAQNNLLKFIAKITKASLQLSQAELMQELEKSSVNKITVGKINSFLTYCEQIKYRPNFQSNENIEKDFQKFQDIYNEIKNR